MALTYPIVSGYIGITTEGFGGTTDPNGRVNRALVTLTWNQRPNPVNVVITDLATHWALKFGNGDIINCTNPVIISKGRNNAVVQFSLETVYPSNSPCYLVYRNSEAYFNVSETTNDPPFTVNTPTGNFGFTTHMDNATVDGDGRVNKVLISFSYTKRLNNVKFTISDSPNHWSARMGDDSIITLRAPQVIMESPERSDVLFNMDTPYPANSPCLLLYRSSEAWYNVQEVQGGEFKAVQRYDGIPATINAGVDFDLQNVIVIPMDATNQEINWSILSPGTAGATIVNNRYLRTTAPGNLILRGITPLGQSISSDFINDSSINVTASTITISRHPIANTEVNFGGITGALSVEASLNPPGTLSYQWYSNTSNSNIGGTVITGATGATFNIPQNLTVNANGQATYYYFCEVRGSNGAASVRSSVAVVTVKVRVTDITINNKITNILALREHQFTTTINPPNSANKNVIWSSDNIAVGVVTAEGLFSAKTNGTVTITVKTLDGNYQDSNVITVAPFVPVNNITNVPGIVVSGNNLTLTGTVNPSNATNKTIVFTVLNDGGTGATITGGNILQVPANKQGIVNILATIVEGLGKNNNYTQIIEVVVSLQNTAVTDIINVPTSIGVGGSVTGTVVPSNASNQTILWSMVNSGSTGATISSDGKILTGNTGVITIRGTVSLDGFYKDFTLNLTLFIPVTSIILGIHNVIDINTNYTLSGTVLPINANNKTITWSIPTSKTITEETYPGSGVYTETTIPVPNTANGSITNGNILRTTSLGTTTVRASIPNGLANGAYIEDFIFIAENAFIPVTNISLEESSFLACGNEIPLRLKPDVSPVTATNKNVIFELVNAGGTGAVLDNSIELIAFNPGTITIKCTIPNGLTRTTDYVQNLQVQVNSIIPVTDITNVPATVYVRTDANDAIYRFSLYPEVEPNNASFKDVKFFLINGNGTGVIVSEAGDINNFQGYGTIEIIGIISIGAGLKPPGEDTSFYKTFFIALLQWIYVNNINPSFELIEYTGTSISLNNSIVEPTNAVKKDILWNITSDDTGSSINNNNILQIGNISGNITIVAIITDGQGKDSHYTQIFYLKILKPIEDIISSFSPINKINNPFNLFGIIVPSSNGIVMEQIITWSKSNDGGTNSTLVGNQLTATNAGTVTVRATVANGLGHGVNYIKDFDITIIKPVTDITLTSGTTINPNTPTQLTGTVIPNDATEQTIVWSISENDNGSTNSTINGAGILTATSTGIITIKATIINGLLGSNYTKEFTISVEAPIASLPYITFESDTDMTINPKFTNTGILEYSTDTITWNSIDNEEETISSKKLYFRGIMNSNTLYTSSTGNNAWTINNGTNVKISGNINTLLNYNNPPTTVDIYAFAWMFYYQSSIVDINELKLPAITLSPDCYKVMFFGCAGLTSIPENFLPATTLSTGSYEGMFGSCISLTDIPSNLLPATTLLPSQCYIYMFQDCSSLVINHVSSSGYSRPFRIPASGTGTGEPDSLLMMFINTAGTMNNTPDINTTYYTKNIIPVTDINLTVTSGIKTNTPTKLNSTVTPNDASRQTILWSISPNDTGITDSGISNDGWITASNEGIVIIRATVVNGLGYGVNYTKDFELDAEVDT